VKPRLKPVQEQVIVITGASSGIGLATAEAAAARGARLVLVARNGEALARIADDLAAQGGEATAIVADVADRSQLEQAAQAAVERHGRIDTWVNNAGVSIFGRIEDVSEADNRRLFETNFWGVVNGSLVALPRLRASGGALVNVGSEASDVVLPCQGMYAASKHAVKGFTDALRVELNEVERKRVSITLVQPTAVDTPFPQHARNYMDREPKLPSPMIDPRQVAQAILEAAEHPVRNVRVGLMAKLNTTLFRVSPMLGEKLAALQAERQQYDAPPREPEGALHCPGEDGRLHGHRPGNA
jgi:short-subunit dehydrogenase